MVLPLLTGMLNMLLSFGGRGKYAGLYKMQEPRQDLAPVLLVQLRLKLSPTLWTLMIGTVSYLFSFAKAILIHEFDGCI